VREPARAKRVFAYRSPSFDPGERRAFAWNPARALLDPRSDLVAAPPSVLPLR